MGATILRVLQDEHGAALIEYGLILGLLSIAGVVAFQAVGDQASVIYNTLAGRVQGVADATPH